MLRLTRTTRLPHEVVLLLEGQIVAEWVELLEAECLTLLRIRSEGAARPVPGQLSRPARGAAPSGLGGPIRAAHQLPSAGGRAGDGGCAMTSRRSDGDHHPSRPSSRRCFSPILCDGLRHRGAADAESDRRGGSGPGRRAAGLQGFRHLPARDQLQGLVLPDPHQRVLQPAPEGEAREGQPQHRGRAGALSVSEDHRGRPQRLERAIRRPPSWTGSTAEQVGEALDDLPEEYRVVATLYFIDDLSYQQIAEALQCPVGTVRSRLHRGRRMLQKALWDVAMERGIN